MTIITLLMLITAVLIYLIPVYIVADIEKSKGKSFWWNILIGIFATPLYYLANLTHERLIKNSRNAPSVGSYIGYYINMFINVISNFLYLFVMLTVFLLILDYLILDKKLYDSPTFWSLVTGISFIVALLRRHHGDALRALTVPKKTTFSHTEKKRRWWDEATIETHYYDVKSDGEMDRLNKQHDEEFDKIDSGMMGLKRTLTNTSYQQIFALIIIFSVIMVIIEFITRYVKW